MQRRKGEDMKINVVYKVNQVHFSAVCDTIAEAYEGVKAIITHEPTAFPHPEEALSGYIELLANISAGITLSQENHILKIFKAEATK